MVEQKQNRRDQRSRVADADPPDEIDDVKAPAYGNIDAPDTDAFVEKPSKAHEQHLKDGKHHSEADKPTLGRWSKNHRVDLFADRVELVPGVHDGEVVWYFSLR